jgi:hypothetical protein
VDETLVARVVDVTAAARIGLEGLQRNDEMQVTLMGQRDKKLKLMHVPGNQAITPNFEQVM